MEKQGLKDNSTNAELSLDQKDISILKLLQEDGKITVREIAHKIHLSSTPVHDRIKRMEDNGVIKQYAALVDYSKVNKGLMIICYVSLKEHNKRSGARFIKTINELNEVIECYNISGQFDFMLKVVVENMDAYYHFHVNKLQSTFVMGVIKQTHQLIY
jgi:Lrp/AsnC family leucine-responsive transcriptional regulator